MKLFVLRLAFLFAVAFFLINPQKMEAQANQNESTMDLNSAIWDFCIYISQKIPSGHLTVVDTVNSPSQSLGNYISDQVTDLLLNRARLRMVSRQDFERILSEQNAQASLNFDDETTAKIGHNIGWQTIIFGGVEPLQSTYHLSLRAVEVETGTLLGSRSYLLTGNDPVLVNAVNPDITIQNLNERDSILAPFDGRQSDFELEVRTNKNVYYDQELLFITLRSSLDCYFVVYHLDVFNKMQLIFPNRWDVGTNSLQAGRERVIPDNTYFLLHAPYGEERILVYASERPISIPDEQYRSRAITEEYLAAPEAIWQGGDGTRTMAVKPKGAARQVSYIILPGNPAAGKTE